MRAFVAGSEVCLEYLADLRLAGTARPDIATVAGAGDDTLLAHVVPALLASGYHDRMRGSGAQVNVRLTKEELDLLDLLRRSNDGDMSRAELLRSLLREKRRAAVDLRIAEAYDAAGPADDDMAEASASAAGEALRGL